MGMKNDEPKRPPKSILYYYGIILVVLLLLNVLIFPSLTERKVTEVTYDQFLDMLDEGLVKGVNRTDDQITFWTEPELPADSAQGEGTMSRCRCGQRMYSCSRQAPGRIRICWIVCGKRM